MRRLLPPVLVVLVALVAYANAWPDSLVLDDKFFENPGRFADWSNIPRYFEENVWASQGMAEPFYRPLFLASITFDARVYGDWVPGFHLTSILLHSVVSLLVYGFLLQLLKASGTETSTARLCALLAALVFAVHPVQTEAVDSIFNRSEILAGAAGLAGLNWLLRFRSARPVLAWVGLALAYLVALFCKESAIVLPALAALLVLVLGPGSARTRAKSCLPVIALAIPLAVYLFMRFNALESPAGSMTEVGAASEALNGLEQGLASGAEAGDATEAGRSGVAGALNGLRLPGWNRWLGVAGAWYQGFRLMVWPFPLQVDIPAPSLFQKYLGLAVHALLLGAAIFMARRKQFGLLLALAFYYLVLLPASRILGDQSVSMQLALRYLYLAVVGLSIAVAFGLRALVRRFDALAAVAVVTLVLIVFTPLTWARNAVWSDELRLLKTDYENGNRSAFLLRLLTAAYILERDYPSVARLCDRNADVQQSSGRLSVHCAIAYGRTGREEEAVQAYLHAASSERSRTIAHANLADLYLRRGQREEAEKHLQLAFETEEFPAMRAFRQGYLLARLYPGDRARLLEAKAAFERALELQPNLPVARTWLARVEEQLGGP